ncbi:shikimate kinase [Herbivorax sp. ANBcel31]|uniref:shikimate kinase n=1 Tax=Herbivorax sp. ANBcel31 TaxID=3069754 RepID=UPI0027B36C41|nr:shikimate kinase [Herbivorax sp. ANBcel31]MDQ2085805.1 shikimate kinase [Herbivorax sp. ANBcel31]
MENIILIGMPSSGKTTIGKPLSKKLNMDFIDTDKIILDNEKKPLKDIVIEDGLDNFLKIQEETILNLTIKNHVISTGGSVIYNKKGIEHLKKYGIIFYLKLDIDEIENRITTKRRFAKNKEQSFSDIYKERTPLYEKYADAIINCNLKSVDTIVNEISKIYKNKVERKML